MAACSHIHKDLPHTRCEQCKYPLDPTLREPFHPRKDEGLLINDHFVTQQEFPEADLRSIARGLTSGNRIWIVFKSGWRVHPNVLELINATAEA